jgi:hypothetical protein
MILDVTALWNVYCVCFVEFVASSVTSVTSLQVGRSGEGCRGGGGGLDDGVWYLNSQKYGFPPSCVLKCKRGRGG